MNEIKILVVDDHAIMRDGIRALLEVHDDMMIVGEASDGREAIEKTQQLSPDLLIMDIAMPGMDGIEAVRRIKKKNPKVKVLFLTQHDHKEYIFSAIKAGAAGYLPKKALGTELISAIRALCHGDSFLYPSAARALIDYYREQSEEPDTYDRLTARERETLKLIAEGHTSRQIADMLIISLKTVMGHRQKIMEKLNIHNRTGLIKYAMRKGLISTDL
jgi:DNA-binding NarL/FixJ family response regulator